MIKAFSLLEFVFIILILGIVFNLGSLYLKKDNLLEGAIQILNDIQIYPKFSHDARRYKS